MISMKNSRLNAHPPFAQTSLYCISKTWTFKMPASPAVQAGVRMLKEDHENGARILATNAVRVLGDVVKELSVAPELSLSVAAFWDALCFAGFQLKAARPSMDAAIGGALIKALFAIRAAWKEDGLETVVDDLQPISKIGVSSLTKASMSAIDSEIQRRMGDRRMAMAFIDVRIMEPLKFFALLLLRRVLLCRVRPIHHISDSLANYPSASRHSAIGNADTPIT